MDIEISAHNRHVRITNANGTLEELAETALGLWASTDVSKEPIASTGFVLTERATQEPQPSFMDYGERPVVK